MIEKDVYKRDSRWENVFGWSLPFFAGYEDEAMPISPTREFLIEVTHGSIVYYQRMLVSESELEGSPELYGLTLDKMVDGIDELLGKAGHGRYIT